MYNEVTTNIHSQACGKIKIVNVSEKHTNFMMQMPLKWENSPQFPFSETLWGTSKNTKHLSWEFRNSGYSLLHTWSKPPLPLGTKSRERQSAEWKEKSRSPAGRKGENAWVVGTGFRILAGLCTFCTFSLPVHPLCCWEEINIKVKYKIHTITQ